MERYYYYKTLCMLVLPKDMNALKPGMSTVN
jgi:hypothetical protein